MSFCGLNESPVYLWIIAWFFSHKTSHTFSGTYKWTMKVPSSSTRNTALKSSKRRKITTRGSNLLMLTCFKKHFGKKMNLNSLRKIANNLELGHLLALLTNFMNVNCVSVNCFSQNKWVMSLCLWRLFISHLIFCTTYVQRFVW